MDETAKIFKTWLKNERKAISESYGRSGDGFPRGMRSELTAVERAFEKALKGELDGNG